MRLWWLAVVSSAGCGVLSGLDGLTITDGGVDDAVAPIDSSLDVGGCESGACGAPAGFQPVLFASDRATACPTGATSLDVVVDPSAPQNACTCECTYQPSCLPQANKFDYGLTNCSGTVTIPGELDGGCNTINTNVGNGAFHMAIGPFAPTNACTNGPKPGAKATAPPGRVCNLTDCSACSSVAGFGLCFAQTGDVACPANMTKHTIGSDAQLTCGACTTCTSTATCKGKLELYSDTQCGSSISVVVVDGTCQAVSNAAIKSVTYIPSIDPGSCTPGTSSESIAINAQTTVCCP